MSRLARCRATASDRGSALMTVLVMMTILSVFASVGLTYAVSTLRFADQSEDRKQALAAAEAGVADYLARLNKADNYWNPRDAATTGLCSNEAIKGPRLAGTCPGFSSTSPVGWARVPGAPRSTFHYDVSTDQTYTRGAIGLTATGKVGTTTRTVQVSMLRGGIGEYLYYTDYETTDPANQVVYANAADAERDCKRYWYNSPSRPSYNDDRRTGCPDIAFTGGDVIKGPLHSNDAILVRGDPTFQGAVTTAMPACNNRPNTTSCYRRTSSSDDPTFARGIAFQQAFTLPDNISTLRQYIDPAQATSPGCLYTGPTRIKFLPTASGSTPQMRVWSKWTTSSQLNPGCGTTSTLGSDAGALLTVPQENLIYVQDVPSGQSSPGTNDCKLTGRIGDGFPVMSDSSRGLYEFGMYLSESNCRYGTAYIEGQLKGRVSVTTDNNIVITGDLTYASGVTGTDSLGLMAKNSINVYHPMKVNCQNSSCSSYTLSEMNRPNGSKFRNPTIQAAMQALQHSFGVQQYDKGSDLGTLRVFGTIGQKYRGPVGTGSSTDVTTGYLKDYAWDSRLRYAPPPYFLTPERSRWGQKTFGEVQAQYRP